MTTDPTQENRDFLANIAKKILPENSPLMKSDSDTLTPEARAQIEQQKIAEQEAAKAPDQAQPQTQDFVPQVAAQPTPVANTMASGPAPAFDFNAQLPSDIKGGLNEQRKAFEQVSEAYKKQAADVANVEAQYNKASEDELKAKQQSEDFAKSVEKDVQERASMRLEPKNFFAGKNTWQKVLGGIGLFLSSFSKEGAARFAEAVDRDIELDLRAQQSAIESKDKTIAEKKSLVKEYFDKYKNMEAARYFAKADAMNMIAAKTQAVIGSIKSQAAAGAARQAYGIAQQNANENLQKGLMALQAKQMDAMAKNNGKVIDVLGFKGMAPTDQEAQKFRESATATKQAIDSINQLTQLSMKGSKLSLEDKAKAETVAGMLKAALRTTIVGPGAVSDNERKMLDNIVANPLEIFSLQKNQLARLQTLAAQVKINLRNQAQTLGIQEVGIGKR